MPIIVSARGIADVFRGGRFAANLLLGLPSNVDAFCVYRRIYVDYRFVIKVLRHVRSLACLIIVLHFR